MHITYSKVHSRESLNHNIMKKHTEDCDKECVSSKPAQSWPIFKLMASLQSFNIVNFYCGNVCIMIKLVILGLKEKGFRKTALEVTNEVLIVTCVPPGVQKFLFLFHAICSHIISAKAVSMFVSCQD